LAWPNPQHNQEMVDDAFGLQDVGSSGCALCFRDGYRLWR